MYLQIPTLVNGSCFSKEHFSLLLSFRSFTLKRKEQLQLNIVNDQVFGSETVTEKSTFKEQSASFLSLTNPEKLILRVIEEM
jgi:hypothetical protein